MKPRLLRKNSCKTFILSNFLPILTIILVVFEEIQNDAQAIMKDVFGNFVIQKVIEYGPEDHIVSLFDTIKGKILELSKHIYGWRVIQKFIEIFSKNSHSYINLIIDGILREHLLEWIYDQYGNHVIQKIIEKIPYKEISFIQQHIENNWKDLWMNTFGWRVIQRIIEYCPDIWTDPIYEQIIGNDVIDLWKDQFGNYVVQLILEKGHRPNDRKSIWCYLLGDARMLSIHKYASNVVEKCIEYWNEEDKKYLIEELLGDKNWDSAEENMSLYKMMDNKYGNYVVQKAIECSFLYPSPYRGAEGYRKEHYRASNNRTNDYSSKQNNIIKASWKSIIYLCEACN